MAIVLAPPAIVRAPYIVDVGQPTARWRWSSVVMAPLELLTVAWSVGLGILLIMVPIGVVLAGILWAGRAIFRL